MKLINNITEEGLAVELKALCNACIHQDNCEYHKNSGRAIIQCELFEEESLPDQTTKGLCAMCDNARTCLLPGRKYGVWRCQQFE